MPLESNIIVNLITLMGNQHIDDGIVSFSKGVNNSPVPYGSPSRVLPGVSPPRLHTYKIHLPLSLIPS